MTDLEKAALDFAALHEMPCPPTRRELSRRLMVLRAAARRYHAEQRERDEREAAE